MEKTAWIPVLLILFTSKSFIQNFHRKTFSYSLALSGIGLLTLGFFQAEFNGYKHSDWLLLASSQFMVLIGITGFLYLRTYVTLYRKKIIEAGDIQRVNTAHQTILLALIFISAFAYTYSCKWVIWVITLVYLTLIFMQAQEKSIAKPIYRKRDYFPYLVLLMIMFGVSFLKVGKVVCAIPGFKECFSCPNY